MGVKQFILITILLLPQLSLGADTQINSSSNFRNALAVSKTSDASFGTIGYTADNFGIFVLENNTGNIVCSNTTDYDCPTSGTRGEFVLSGQTGLSVDIFCDSTGILANSGSTLNISANSFFIDSTSVNCQGLTTAVHEHILDSDSNENIFFTGHVLIVTSGSIGTNGLYSTANTGGDPIKFSFAYK